MGYHVFLAADHTTPMEDWRGALKPQRRLVIPLASTDYLGEVTGLSSRLSVEYVILFQSLGGSLRCPHELLSSSTRENHIQAYLSHPAAVVYPLLPNLT
jgi:hypothetical protein